MNGNVMNGKFLLNGTSGHSYRKMAEKAALSSHFLQNNIKISRNCQNHLSESFGKQPKIYRNQEKKQLQTVGNLCDNFT
jgi:hypothetical protein